MMCTYTAHVCVYEYTRDRPVKLLYGSNLGSNRASLKIKKEVKKHGCTYASFVCLQYTGCGK
jgi:hypothetical protein